MFRVWCLGSGFGRLGIRDQAVVWVFGLGFKVWGSGFGVYVLGSGFAGLGFEGLKA